MTVQVQNNLFTPRNLTIAVGDTVVWVNQSGIHNVVANDGSFASPGLAKGETWQHTFAKPGTYTYHLKEHPKAVGKVIVLEQAPAAPAPR